MGSSLCGHQDRGNHGARLRLVLASLVLVVALRMLWGLGVRPDEIYTVTLL